MPNRNVFNQANKENHCKCFPQLCSVFIKFNKSKTTTRQTRKYRLYKDQLSFKDNKNSNDKQKRFQPSKQGKSL